MVDDNRDALRIYSTALRRGVQLGEPLGLGTALDPPKLEVETAVSVEEAIKKLRAQRYDIAIIDLRLGGENATDFGGRLVIDEALQLDPIRPVIVLTGFGTIELAASIYRQGIFDFIEKSSQAAAELAAAVQRALDARLERIRRVGNPFTPKTGDEPTVFGGRSSELEFFDERLLRAVQTRFRDHFLVVGDWGIGKSTLLREFKRIGQARGYITAIAPLESMTVGAPTIDAARSLVESILRDLPYTVERLKSLSSFFSSVGITVLGTGLQFARDTTKRELSTQAFLHDTMQRLWSDVSKDTEVLTVLLDDLDNFAQVPEVLLTLKQTLAMPSLAEAKILVGMSATPRCWQEVTGSERHHPLARYFTARVDLGPLTGEEMRETIRRSLLNTGVSFDDSAIDRVVEYSRGHPYELQVLCYYLFHNQILGRVTSDAWDKAISDTLQHLGRTVFERWLDRATAAERVFLNRLSLTDGPVQIRELLSTNQQVANADAVIRTDPSTLAARLVRKELLQRRGRGIYDFTDLMFRAYLRAIKDT